MATTIPELITKLTSDESSVNTASTHVENSRLDTGELLDQFHALGAGESHTAETLRAVETQLGNIRHALLGTMAKAIKDARRLIEQSQGHPTTSGPMSSAAATNATTGNPVTAPKTGPGDLQQELKGSPDDGDSEQNKWLRFGRGFSRGADTLSKSVNQEFTSANAARAPYKGNGSGTVETVGVADHKVSMGPSVAHNPTAPDGLGSLVVQAALVVSIVGQIKQRKQAR